MLEVSWPDWSLRWKEKTSSQELGISFRLVVSFPSDAKFQTELRGCGFNTRGNGGKEHRQQYFFFKQAIEWKKVALNVWKYTSLSRIHLLPQPRKKNCWNKWIKEQEQEGEVLHVKPSRTLLLNSITADHTHATWQPLKSCSPGHEQLAGALITLQTKRGTLFFRATLKYLDK